MSSSLSSITTDWFAKYIGSPTPVQSETWDAAASGKHILVVAPTGSGKTLAAFLVALDRLYTGSLATGALRVLYISPLKALGADIRENLTGPLRELKAAFNSAEIRIGIRNGDTTPSERRRQITRPPEILVTTPESLNILLLSDGGRGLLSTVEICILDEIHAIASSRRGTLLVCALERLVDLAGEVQRIGLTATVRPVERAAAFLGGYRPAGDPEYPGPADPVPREVRIIAPPSSKEIVIRLEALPAPPETGGPDPDGFWRDIATRMRRDIREKRSTLAFIDSRKWSEKLARLINEGEEEVLAWAHHGSLSKDMRRLVERRLKEGRLKAVVATGSLELGIDIGPLDEVIMLGTPASPSVTLQRAGRAGHKPDTPSRARIFPITPGDLLAGTVLAKMAEEGEIEEIKIPENPLDILAQTILALCAERGRKVEELRHIINRVWSFRNLPRESFDSVLAMLRGRYADTRINALKPRLYLEGDRLTSRPGTRMHLYTGGGAIPDLGMYSVREQGVNGVLGSLDEKFVWESQPGAVFHLGNRRWRIIGINDRDVTVVPTDEAVNTEPFWRADGRNRDEEYARRIAELLEEAESILADAEASQTLEDYLISGWGLEPEQSAELAAYLRSQCRRGGGALPHRHHIVAEAASDPDTGGEPGSRTLFLHTMLGGRVNRPLALALQAAWGERSPIPALPTVTDETIAFTLDDGDIEEFTGLLRSIVNPEALIRRVLEATPFFGGRFREAAGRALLLPSSTPRRRQPLWMTRQRSRMLLEAVSPYPDFPLMSEVWRSCLNDEFAMEALDNFLTEIRDGEILISIVRTPAPSPFSDSAVRRRLSRQMTANMRDQSDARFVSRLESEEIHRLSRAGSLRPRIPPALAARLDSRRRRIEPGYAPGSIGALKAWIAEREAFDTEDWAATIEASAAEIGASANDLKKSLSASVKSVELGPGRAPWIIAAEYSKEWAEAFGTTRDSSRASDEQARLISFWLTGRGPVESTRLLNLFGLKEGSGSAGTLLSALSESDAGGIVIDRISEDEGEAELCDEEGLEILLRWRRRQSRNADAPLPAHRLAPFLAVHQGLTNPKSGEDGLASVVASLEGYPASAGAWETSIFPTRMSPYRPADLDALVSREELIWVGTGEQRVTFLTADGGWRYPAPELEPEADSTLITREAFPSPGDAPRGFWDIAEALGLDSAGTTKAIWDRVWTGRLTTDDTKILRQAASAGFKAAPVVNKGRPNTGGLRGWRTGRPVTGRWYAPSYSEEPEDPMVSDRLMRERIRLLLKRYGLLSRPLLEREIPTWRWPILFRTLNLMELGDEVIGGRWFEGLPMPQFLAPESLQDWRDGADPGRPWCIEATDPASPCGTGVSSYFPSRREGTWMVWNGDGQLIFTFQQGRKNIDIPENIHRAILACSPEKLTEYTKSLDHLAALVLERSVSPLTRLTVKTVNGCVFNEKQFQLLLEEAGFSPNGIGAWMRRPRPIGLR